MLNLDPDPLWNNKSPTPDFGCAHILLMTYGPSQRSVKQGVEFHSKTRIAIQIPIHPECSENTANSYWPQALCCSINRLFI